MCSVNEEYDEAQEFIPEEKCQLLDDALCQKCNVERAFVLLRGKDVYCNTCFLASATHKFRATLGKSKIVRPTDKILVAHSGKAGSTALLHLIKAGMHESVHKRLMFETKVLYVDDGAVKGQSLEDRKTTIEAIKNQIDSLGYESFAVSLSQILIEKESNIQSLENFSNSLVDLANSDEALKSIFEKLPDRTSSLDLLKKLRQRLIFKTSRKLGCNKIFVADDSTSLACDILSNVSLGRGSQLAYDVGFLDNRYSDVNLLRPMRDFTRHELVTYLKIHNLEIIEFEEFPGNSGTIQKLTERFVMDLDSRFNGTVSTIFRTGEKVCSGNLLSKNRYNDDNCALCDAPLDTLASDTIISAIQATAFSRLVSSQGPNGNLDSSKIDEYTNSSLKIGDKSNGCGNCYGSCDKNKDIFVSPESLRKILCYSCRLIFKNVNIKDVPSGILKNVQERLSFESMREEIGDFLL